MRINSSESITLASNRAQRNASDISKTLAKLSSGVKISKASDNAAGLAISETMRAQVRGLSQAQSNMQNGISILESSNEGLSTINEMLHRGRELAVSAANDTLTDDDRRYSSMELDQLLKAIDETAENLEFNTLKILGGEGPIQLQIGANNGQKMSIGNLDVSTTKLGIAGASVATRLEASDLIDAIDKAASIISSNLTKIGAEMKSIEHHLTNSLVYEGNITKSFSMLKDTDMAKEMMSFVQQDIRQKGDQMLIKSINSNLQESISLLR